MKRSYSHENTCAICMDEVTDDRFELPKHGTDCGHVFHAECFYKHAEWSKFRNVKCPTCRTEVGLETIMKLFPAIEAINTNDCDELYDLLEAGEIDLERLYGECTALAHAAMRGNAAAVEVLLQYGADVHAPNSSGRAEESLKRACANGHYEIAKILLDAGAVANANPRIAIAACKSGSRSVVRLLVEHGCDFASGEAGESLCWAAVRRQHQIVELLLDLNVGFTPLSYQKALQGGCVAGCERSVKALLEAGVEPHEKALKYAAFAGRLRILKLLLEYGADAKKAGDALYEACKRGCIDSVEVLVAAGADVVANDRAALRVAELNNHDLVVDFLLQHGA